MKKSGFYIIKEEFFEEVNDPYLRSNKGGNRPHYYCLEDSGNGIYWVIPLSSRIAKYESIIQKREQSGRSCDTLHIVEWGHKRKSVFLIQDMFPVTEEYVEREYTVNGQHVVIKDKATIRAIEKKAKTVRKRRLRGVKFLPTQADINRILKILKDKRS